MSKSTTSRLLVGLLCGLVALAAHAVPQDLIFIFDNSGSMRKADPGFAARDEARKFLGALTGDIHAGVIVFDQEVVLTAPLTVIGEGSALGTSLDKVDYKGRWTDSPAAVERAIYELKTNGRADAQKSVVFMTDGIVDTGNRQLDAQRTAWLRDDLAADAAASGIRIYGVAFTDAADLLLIQSLATKTHAEYFRAPSPTELPAALGKVLASLSTAAVAVPMPAPEAPVPEAATPPESLAPPAVPEPAAPSVPTIEEATPNVEEAPAAPTTPETTTPAPAASGPALSAEERESLEQLSKETGIPVEQLINEMNNAQPGQAIVTPPDDEIAPPEVETAEPGFSMGNVGAIVGAILAALLLVGWFARSRGRKAPDSASASASSSTSVKPAAAPTLEAWLVDINGLAGEAPKRLSDKPLMVGRIAGSDPDFLDYYVVNKATIGRRHAVIKFKDGAYWIVDQGSVNGTFVNNEKVLGERQLRHGDRIKFHKFEFEFQCPGMAGAERTMVGMSADQTIVASMDATIAATSATGLHSTAAISAVGTAAFAAAAPALEEEIDLFADDVPAKSDTNDITAEGELAALERDKSDFFTSSGSHGNIVDSTQALPPPADDSDYMEFEESPLYGADASVPQPADATGDFDTEASAFFEDVTVHPGADLLKEPSPDADFDVLDVTVARDPAAMRPDVNAGEDFSTATTILPARFQQNDGTTNPLSTGTFSQMTTVLRDDEAVLDNTDETLGNFLATSSFDQPAAKTAGTSASTQGSAGEVRDYLDTGPLETTQPPQDIDDVFDVTGELDAAQTESLNESGNAADAPLRQDTIVMPRSPVAGGKDEPPPVPPRRPK